MTTLELSWRVVAAPQGRLQEGVRWLPEAGVFQWVDILTATLHRWDPYASAAAEVRPLELEFATLALPIAPDQALVASRDSLHVYDWVEGTLTEVGSWSFDPDVRFNDGSLSPAGEVYIGTMSMEGRPDAGSLYRYRDGRLTTILDGVGISNGMDWLSPDRALYVDSTTSRVDLLTLREGELIDRRAFCDLPGAEPDGLTLTPDGDGRALVALWGSSEIAEIGDGGVRASYAVPARFPSSVAVGGRQGELIAVTTASEDDGSGGNLLVADWRG